ncbi:Allergen V5/Tpx-1-related [Macleaya cordata]|uniref:Allergen V5/Tpx-1-related n=1 Tax=Macleaya cordata TaxID=56857 RepID=A0A200Q5H1_MACCD|nr:Allergen V5/Tpx-1-related [Macleaya cordata]
MARLYCTSKLESASVICLIGLTLALLMQVSQAQTTPQDFLAPHNAARANVSVGPMTWNTTVAAYAMAYANQRVADCNLTLSGGPYGENLATSTSSNVFVGDAVKLWVSTKIFYDYKSNSCIGGNCGTYTQVVWRNSTDLGCASVTCSNGGTFVICSYYPPGNIVGERPY